MKQFKVSECKEIAIKIAELTDNNDHTQAKIECAKFFGLLYFIRVFECIKVLSEQDGFLCSELSDLRCRQGKAMINQIERLQGKEIRDFIYSAF